MGALSGWHWFVVVAIGMAMFLPGKLVERMRDVGKSVKQLKKAGDDD